ncbi:MAG TPA: mechanosensitive ion channel family protein [Acidimicrobiia bacterium]|nr:mechanosensitive ion channel family protein [Acidimicrobiia bacterium]
MLLAQTETPPVTLPPLEEGERPLTDFLVDLLDLERQSLTAGVLGWIIEPVLQVVTVVAVAWIASRLLRRLVRRVVRRMKGRPPGALSRSFADSQLMPSTRRVQRLDALGTVFSSVVGFVVWTIAIVTILGSTFGVNVGPLIAGAGILGVALGFGAQDLVKDVLSGMFMLVEDQYGVGDVIDVGEATGIVEGLGLRTTRIRDVTGTLWHVPNGEINRVGNMSQQWSRALLDIGVGYSANVDEAAAVIKGVADEMAAEEAYRTLFLDEPQIWGVESLSADAVVIRLVIKTKPGEQWPIARELRRRIKIALDEASIEIPFPQRTVWLRSESEKTQIETPPDLSAPSEARGRGAPEEGTSADSDASDGQR